MYDRDLDQDPQFIIFRAGLDAKPDDHELRLVFSDWLEQRGDWRAAGYRWMGEQTSSPTGSVHRVGQDRLGHFGWWSGTVRNRWVPTQHTIFDKKVVDALREIKPDEWVWPTLREAEEALCKCLLLVEQSTATNSGR